MLRRCSSVTLAHTAMCSSSILQRYVFNMIYLDTVRYSWQDRGNCECPSVPIAEVNVALFSRIAVVFARPRYVNTSRLTWWRISRGYLAVLRRSCVTSKRCIIFGLLKLTLLYGPASQYYALGRLQVGRQIVGLRKKEVLIKFVDLSCTNLVGSAHRIRAWS